MEWYYYLLIVIALYVIWFLYEAIKTPSPEKYLSAHPEENIQEDNDRSIYP